jgi:signal transduction histidine kinase/ActR/RegA family two-component response regulator
MEAGEPYEMEHRLRMRDGSYRWHLSRARPGRDAAGRVVKWYGTATDIDASKRDELNAQFLVELDAELNRLTAPEEIEQAAVNRLGQHLGVDRCFFVQIDEPYGVIAREWRSGGVSLVNRHLIADYYTPEVVALLRAGQSLAISDTATDARAARNAANYAALRVGSMATAPVTYQGRWVGALSVIGRAPRAWRDDEQGLLREISARVWPLIERARAVAAVRESKARFDIVRDGAQVGFWFCDLPFDKLIWDNRVKEHFWLPPDAEVTIDTFYQQLHPDDRERTRQAIDESIANRTRYEIEYRTLSPAGQEKWVRAIGRTFYDAQGNPIRFDGVTLDITERKRAEEALKENDRRKDEFLAMLAHELRNPLAPIRNAAQVLKLTGPPDANQQWAREVIERQAQHLTRLVDDLLDVSRITSGKVTLQRETLDLSAVIQRAVEASRPLIDARKHRLTVALAAEPLRVAGDLTRLVQAVSNLLNNAAKYTDEGGSIEVTTGREGAEAVVRVRDDGLGLAADLLPHVFDLFTQAERSLDRSQGGLGIGLTLVRQLVEMHGGRAEAKSDGPGRGSEFEVRLPLLEAPTSEPGGRGAERRTPNAERRTALRVLVVEDNVDSAEMLSFMLKLGGHETRMAHDGWAALEAARQFQPQVILCDIGLPGMNGYEVAQQLRAQPPFKQTRLVAISGYGQDEDRRRSKDAGFDYHLTKPVEPDALAALLESLKSDGRGK